MVEGGSGDRHEQSQEDMLSCAHLLLLVDTAAALSAARSAEVLIHAAAPLLSSSQHTLRTKPCTPNHHSTCTPNTHPPARPAQSSLVRSGGSSVSLPLSGSDPQASGADPPCSHPYRVGVVVAVDEGGGG